MIRFNADFRINPNGKLAEGGRARRFHIAHQALDSQVIKDTNEFVPFRTGTLASSPNRSPKVGEIVYNTPYARRLYYGTEIKFNRTFHPQAGPAWIERSKAIWLPKWRAIVAKIIGG